MATEGAEITVPGKGTLSQINAINMARMSSERAMRTRKLRNQMNVDTYLGKQDWSHKKPGQSKEFLPKTGNSVEIFAAFIKRALTSLGEWYSVEMPNNDIIRPGQVVLLMNCFLANLADGMRETVPFGIRISDAVKVGLLQSLIVLKVHGFNQPKQVFIAERGKTLIDIDNGTFVKENTEVTSVTTWPWRLAIDLIDPNFYFPDPNGHKLYEIHRVERDLHDVVAMADQGVYDPQVVDLIMNDFEDAEEQLKKTRRRNQDPDMTPTNRRRVIIDEYWGDMLDEHGLLAERNVVSALANERYLIRPAEKNPTAHGESPIVAAPLLRVPFSWLFSGQMFHCPASLPQIRL